MTNKTLGIEIKLDSKRKIEALDYLKGFSIFTISLMHFLNRMDSIPSKIQYLGKIGGTGVHTFFLLSGIGLFLSYLNKETTYSEFILRRFSKIYVPYVVIIIISYFFPWMYTDSDRFTALLSHIFLFKMFVSKYVQSFGTQFWFISTIIQFYLIFIPMCALKTKIKNNAIFVSLFFAISLCWWIFCSVNGLSDARIWNSFLLQYIWEFALGFIIAEKMYYGESIYASNFTLLFIAILGISCQAALAILSDSFKVFNDIPALFGYTALGLLLMNFKFIKKLFILLSRISYEYYLVHMLVFTTFYYFIKPSGLLLQCFITLISLLASIIVSIVFQKLLKLIISF